MITTLSNWIANNQGKWFCIAIIFIVVGCGVADSITMNDEQRAMEINSEN